jgi:hypothetical protein
MDVMDGAARGVVPIDSSLRFNYWRLVCGMPWVTRPSIDANIGLIATHLIDALA